MKSKILVFAFLLVSSSCSIFKTSQTINEKNTDETSTNVEVVSDNIYKKFLGDFLELTILNFFLNFNI